MKLIIEIPAETYAFVKQLQMVSLGRGNCKTIQQTVINSIKFGVEQPQGEWIEKVETKQLGHGWLTTHEIVCSVCGGSGENDENIPQCWKFCPNCGADMRGGNNG